MPAKEEGICPLLGKSCGCAGESKPGIDWRTQSFERIIFAKKSRQLMEVYIFNTILTHECYNCKL